jgi:carbon starvation protein CstA
MDRVNGNPTPLSCRIKSKRSKMLAIGFVALVSICALAALAIALYFLISSKMNTTSTTSTTTTSTTTGKHYSDLHSRAMKSKDFAK